MAPIAVRQPTRLSQIRRLTARVGRIRASVVSGNLGRELPNDSRGSPSGNHVIGNIPQHDTSRADHAVAANPHARADRDRRAQPHVVLNDDGRDALPALSASPVVFDWVQCRHQLGSGPDPARGADGDRCIVHQECVGVDEDCLAQVDVEPIFALQARDDHDAITDCSQELVQHAAADVVGVRRGSVKYVELSSAATSQSPQLIIVEVPLATIQPVSLLTHGQMLAPSWSTDLVDLDSDCELSPRVTLTKDPRRVPRTKYESRSVAAKSDEPAGLSARDEVVIPLLGCSHRDEVNWGLAFVPDVGLPQRSNIRAVLVEDEDI